MGNETEKNQQNPGQRPRQSWKPSRPEPEESVRRAEKHVYNPQDPTTKKPGQDSGTTDRPDREGSEDVEKRRAS